jgi:hypothetical protein
MIVLDFPAGPLWIDLPHGVRLRCKPFSTAVLSAAKLHAARELDAARASGGLDEDGLRGLGFAAFVRGLARYTVVEWEGVGDTAGAPLPCTPDHVSALMDAVEDVAIAFERRAVDLMAAVRAEGNG